MRENRFYNSKQKHKICKFNYSFDCGDELMYEQLFIDSHCKE